MSVIWASTRKVYNAIARDSMGFHTITASPDELNTLSAICTMMPANSRSALTGAFRDDAVVAGLRWNFG